MPNLENYLNDSLIQKSQKIPPLKVVHVSKFGKKLDKMGIIFQGISIHNGLIINRKTLTPPSNRLI
jgi:hypothetical protein